MATLTLKEKLSFDRKVELSNEHFVELNAFQFTREDQCLITVALPNLLDSS